MAPRVGFEPTTSRLTAGCSTTELPRNIGAPGGAALGASLYQVSRAKQPVPMRRVYPTPNKEDASIARHKLRFGEHEIPLPNWKPLRIALGIAFILGGMFAILPVLGLWMIPVGVFILSIDLPPVRRFRRRMFAWYGHSWLRRRVEHLSQRWSRAADKKKGPSG